MTKALKTLMQAAHAIERSTTAVSADSMTASQLKVVTGAPLIRIRAVLTDANGKLLALDECLVRPDRAHLQDSLTRPTTRASRFGWLVNSD